MISFAIGVMLALISIAFLGRKTWFWFMVAFTCLAAFADAAITHDWVWAIYYLSGCLGGGHIAITEHRA